MSHYFKADHHVSILVFLDDPLRENLVAHSQYYTLPVSILVFLDDPLRAYLWAY